MNTNSLRRSRALEAAGLLLSAGGLLLLLAAFLAPSASATLFVMAAAGLLFAAGVGLLLRRRWAWYLGLVVAVSGAVVVAVRLVIGGAGEWPWLLPSISADLVLVFVLLWEGPRFRGGETHA
jgi:hypothetical protein